MGSPEENPTTGMVCSFKLCPSLLFSEWAEIMKKTRRGYSLVELIIVVVFLGILAAVAIPRLNLSAVTKQRADTIARKLTTDLRRIRRMAISDAAGNTSGFALNLVGSAPYSSYEIKNLNTAVTVDSHTIDSSINCTGGNNFEFGPLGNLLTGSDSTLTVAGAGRSFTITIIPATGAVKFAEN